MAKWGDMDHLKKGEYYLPELENIEGGKETLNTFDVEKIDIVALLWQTGYLTFDKEIRMMNFVNYKMKISNIEIQNSLNALFLDYLTNLRAEKSSKQMMAVKAIISADLKKLETALTSFFSSIPYQNYVKNNVGEYEGYYASVLFTFLSSLGFDAVPEDSTNKGRIDMTLKLPDKTYIVEFKVDVPEETALQQIKAKQYYEKYLSEGKDIFLLGMHFSSDAKNISGFEWEKL